MQIGKKDIVWNIAATFMRIASGLIVLPLVLRMLPREEVGLWNVFLGVGSLITLFDFGFSNSFSRNITYIFSGVKHLKATGYDVVDKSDTSVDYGLLRSVIRAMRRFYGILSAAFLGVFVAVSPFYLSRILENYSGDKHEIWVAWFLFGILVAYQMYTYYYGAMLNGRGFVKRYHQNVVIGQACRIICIVILLLSGYGIIALVIGQLVGDLTNRTLSYRSFYDKDIKSELKKSTPRPVMETMKIMAPNAFKIGLTTLGGFFVNKAVLLIAPMYLTLADVGSYGTTKQLIDLVGSLGALWFSTFYPKITLHRVNDELNHLKRMYVKGKLALIAAYLVCGTGLILVGPLLMDWIHSKTPLLPVPVMVLFLFVAFLENNHSLSAQMLLTKNEVPFAKASILSGAAVVVLLYLGWTFTNLGVWVLILAPGLSQLVYQNWKWPLEVIHDLNLKLSDYWNTLMVTIGMNRHV